MRLVYAIAAPGMTDTRHLQTWQRDIRVQHPPGTVRPGLAARRASPSRPARRRTPRLLQQVFPRPIQFDSSEIGRAVRAPLAGRAVAARRTVHAARSWHGSGRSARADARGLSVDGAPGHAQADAVRAVLDGRHRRAAVDAPADARPPPAAARSALRRIAGVRPRRRRPDNCCGTRGCRSSGSPNPCIFRVPPISRLRSAAARASTPSEYRRQALAG